MPQTAKPLAQITPIPQKRPATVARRSLSSREKAAVIVRLMLAEGAPLPLNSLPEHMQASLAEQMGHMRLVDRETLAEVVTEFLDELQDVGLSFPGGIEGALTMMDGHISPTAANRLRRLAGASAKADPWDRIMALPGDRLRPVLEEESVEVAAVMLSKLPVPKAAELLGQLQGARARRIAYAISLTGNVDPETVRRIGLSLAAQLDNLPARAFDAGPVERIGAILNNTPQLMRDEVLAGLDQDDAGFAERVRRAIFTFVHIPARLNARDVPKVIRLAEQPTLVTALSAAMTSPETARTADFILNNMSQRMAQALREDMETRGKVKDRDAETAMNDIVGIVRQLEASGDIILVQPDD
jgi:flagellar motor switch protein FliG